MKIMFLNQSIEVDDRYYSYWAYFWGAFFKKKSFEKLDTLIGNVFIGITRVLHNNTEFFSCTVSCDFQKITKQAIF